MGSDPVHGVRSGKRFTWRFVRSVRGIIQAGWTRRWLPTFSANRARWIMGQFSEILMDHFNSPRNSGRIETPDRVGIAGSPGRGPYVALYLRLAGDVISEAQFQTHGCGVSIACGSMLTEMIIGRAADECLELTPERLSEALDGVPGTKLHCPALAIAALKDALSGWGATS
jgi:nitrogen fixation protein NifU and related proteins